VDAFLAWLTTPPTTLAGVLATLDHAARRAHEDGNRSHVYTNLAKASQYDLMAKFPQCPEAAEQFPAMIATALHKITS
jgi:hypothetical protein